MKKIVSIVLTILLINVIQVPVFAVKGSNSIIVSYNTDNNEIKERVCNEVLGAKKGAYKRYKRFDVYEFSDVIEATQARKRFRGNKNVASADYNIQFELMDVIPNDALFYQQWSHCFTDAAIGWEAAALGQEVVVAVIDTGVKIDHPDLSGRLLEGYNTITGGTDVTDNKGHGTFVSGIIAAAANNEIGVAGVAGQFNVKILPIKIDNETANIDLAEMLEGVLCAIDRGADVINISLGAAIAPEEIPPIFVNIINDALNADITIAASAGNDYDSTVNYPASFEGVISVGSHNSSGVKSSFSNYNEFVDLSAPGEIVYSTTDDGGYDTGNGTSYSSPYVAGIAALIKSLNPQKTRQNIYDILTTSAIKPPGQEGRSDEYGYGYANVAGALRSAVDYDYDADIELNWNYAHLTNEVGELLLETTVPLTYNGQIAWCKTGDTVVTLGTGEYPFGKIGESGNLTVTAKIPLGIKEVQCDIVWNSQSASTNLEDSLTDFTALNGVLMGNFHPNKFTYQLNTTGGVMPIISPVISDSGISYTIKNVTQLGQNSVAHFEDGASGHDYFFVAKQLDDGLYPYYVEQQNDTLFAVTAYKSAGEDYDFLMVCAVYDADMLADIQIIPIEAVTGYTTFETLAQVSPGQQVKVMFLNDSTNVKPLNEFLLFNKQ
ncbi:MAG: S8 family serine peptidase [Clostridiaceae bacterium]|nr:S8 family serine peptidase [Clostridiaceae bacterium]